MSITSAKRPRTYLSEARIRKGYVNRGVAAMVVPFSQETIGRHERGENPMTPEDALLYADNYGAPEIPHHYCAECPIGRRIGHGAEPMPLAQAVLQVSYISSQIEVITQTMQCIALDGIIDADEQPVFDAAMATLTKLRSCINNLSLCGMTQKSPPSAATGNGRGRGPQHSTSTVYH